MLDEVCGRLEEIGEKLDKVTAFNVSKGPMTRMFKRDLQYQYATISAGSYARIYYLSNPHPDNWIGIITQVGNSFFENTYMEWFVDYLPKKVEYQIAEIHNPKHFERGIPFEYEIEWKGFNNSDEDHVFEVLCDGFFVHRDVYEKLIRK